MAPEVAGFLAVLEDAAEGLAEGVLDSELNNGRLNLTSIVESMLEDAALPMVQGFGIPLKELGKTWEAVAARGFIEGLETDVVVQGLEKLTGLSKTGITWQNLVESAVETAASLELGKKVLPGKGYLKAVERDVAEDTINDLTEDALYNESFSISLLAAQMIGTVMGAAIAEEVKQHRNEQAIKKSEGKAKTKYKQEIAGIEKHDKRTVSNSKTPITLESYYKKSTEDSFYTKAWGKVTPTTASGDGQTNSPTSKSNNVGKGAGFQAKTEMPPKTRLKQQQHKQYVAETSSVWAKRASAWESDAADWTSKAEDDWDAGLHGVEYWGDTVDDVLDGLEGGLGAVTSTTKISTNSAWAKEVSTNPNAAALAAGSFLKRAVNYKVKEAETIDHNYKTARGFGAKIDVVNKQILKPIDYDVFMIAGGEIGLGLVAKGIEWLPSAVKDGGFFGRGGSESSVTGEAANHICGLRLQKQLGQEEASTLFNSKDELSKSAIQNSVRLPLKINNPQLKQILSERPGSILDWGKFETTPIHTPNGLARMHFYHNPVTGDTYYGIDFKAIYDHQGSWNVEHQPKYEFNPPRYNP